jgi:hypothetical protein
MTQELPSCPELDSVRTLTPKDRLAERFERRAPGSNFTTMCERWADRREQVGVECEGCEGLGYRLFSPREMAYWKERIEGRTGHVERQREKDAMTQASKCEDCKGTGYVSQRPGDFGDLTDVRFTTAGCPHCRGRDWRKAPSFPLLMHTSAGSSCGKVRVEDEESASLETWEVCASCGGDAYVVPITARPTMKTQDERERWSGEGEDDPGFELFLRMHPEAAPKVAPEESIPDVVALAIPAFWGEHGDRWAQHEFGRRFALWPFTEAGAKLADASALSSSAATWYERRIDIIARERQTERDGQASTPRRRVLIAKADTEARGLERRVAIALRAIEAA